MKKPLICIVGPTAVGKSQVALKLAQQFDGEIISCDAMQVYREVSIANNKPPAMMVNAIQHHLINAASVEEEFDVVKFDSLAKEAIDNILAKGRIPFIVGGTGMYLQILLDGIFEAPKENKFLRNQLLDDAERNGSQQLYQKLQQLDPQAAAKIHPNDAKRLSRALEVVLTTGKPISELQKEREGLWDKYDFKVFVINRGRDELYEMINSRVDAMIEEGLVEEIKSLSKYALSKTAGAMIGIKELQPYFDGECTLEEAKKVLQKNTRNYAKRQLTWFRKDPRFTWIELGAGETIDTAIQKISERLK